jgi:hypothetical protein
MLGKIVERGGIETFGTGKESWSSVFKSLILFMKATKAINP